MWSRGGGTQTQQQQQEEEEYAGPTWSYSIQSYADVPVRSSHAPRPLERGPPLPMRRSVSSAYEEHDVHVRLDDDGAPDNLASYRLLYAPCHRLRFILASVSH